MSESKPTRAELLRQKREQRPRRSQSASRSRAPKTTPSNFPPVLIRGTAGTAAISHSNKKSRNARRRFDIALNGQGAEIRLPAIPSLRFGWRLLSLLTVAVLSLMIYFLWSSPLFSVDDIEVSGLVRLSDEQINAVVDIVGKSIIFVDAEQVRQQLETAFPELENISVKTEVPNKVMVNLVERQPVLAWQENGQTYWIDEFGIAYLPHGDNQPSIIVQGNDLLTQPGETAELQQEEQTQDLRIPIELVNSILVLQENIPENSPITYDNQHGIGWFDPRGWQVYFGNDGEDMKLKWNVYWKTFKRLKQAGIMPALISVEHLHAPYYRLER